MSRVQLSESARQNADLTFKLNRHYGRHGWLRLTPAYSVKLVSDILATSDRGIRVLDPFSGTATTPLCAAYAGNTATGVEINPFLTWFGNVKLATYSPACVRRASDALAHLISQASRKQAKSVVPPPMHNLQRWWNPEQLDFLCRFKAALDDTTGHDCATRDLLLVVFCRLVINFSNAAFNHQSMSFKDKVKAEAAKGRQPALFDMEPDLAFIARVEGQEVLGSAGDNPGGVASIIAGDSRSISNAVSGEYDLLITSPPYPNRSVAVLGMRNGTSQSPFRPALGDKLYVPRTPRSGVTAPALRASARTPTAHGLTACRMRLHLTFAGFGTHGPFATSARRSRLRLPRTTRLALRASLAGSAGCPTFGS